MVEIKLLTKFRVTLHKPTKTFGVLRKTLGRRHKIKSATQSRMSPDSVLVEENKNCLVRHIKSIQRSSFPMTRKYVKGLAYNFAKQLGVQ